MLLNVLLQWSEMLCKEKKERNVILGDLVGIKHILIDHLVWQKSFLETFQVDSETMNS